MMRFAIYIGLAAMVAAFGTPLRASAQNPPRQFPLPFTVREIPKPVNVVDATLAQPVTMVLRQQDATEAMERRQDATATNGRPLEHQDGSIVLATHAEPSVADQRSLRIGANSRSNAFGRTSGSQSRGPATGVTKVVGSLAVVMGLLFGFVWISRRFGSTGNSRLPDEVVQVLGQFSIGARQQVCVVRFGSKLLALSVQPTGVETLGELDDLIEVDALTQLCLSRDSEALPERVRVAVDRYAANRGS